MLYCVLIVDDDFVSNFIAEKVIKSHGAVRMVTTVTDGRQALKYLDHQCNDEDDPYACPDLILLDLNMPHIDGYEFVQNYRKRIDKDIPVVAVTSTDPQEEKIKMLEEAGITYITKPLSNEKFSSIIEELFHIS